MTKNIQKGFGMHCMSLLLTVPECSSEEFHVEPVQVNYLNFQVCNYPNF